MKRAEFFPNVRRGIVAAAAFFGTLCVLSVSYAVYVTLPSTASSGATLSSSEWNKIITGFTALDSQLSTVSTQVTTHLAKNCPSGMTKIGDFCIDNTSVLDAAGEDQKMAMQRCVGQGKHLCSFGEYKMAWVTNATLICPSGVGRYSSPEVVNESGIRNMTVFECGNCSSPTDACM